MRFADGLARIGRAAAVTHPVACAAAAAIVAATATDTRAQSAWRPDKAVEIIASAAPGGSNDQIARLMQRVLEEGKVLPTSVPVTVMNKPGGNQTLGVAYLAQRTGDPHYLLLTNPTLLGNHIAGLSAQRHSDFSPISMLLEEPIVFSVRSDSPVKNLRDLLARLSADPSGTSIGIISRGGSTHLSFALAAKSAGVDPKKLKFVVFKGNAESVTALLGGHLQLVVSSISSTLGQAKAGNLRMLAIVAPARLPGEFADIPTLAEQGVATSLANWRAMFGPKGMTPAQLSFWEDAFARMAAREDWRKALETALWAPHFLRSRDTARYLDRAYDDTKAIMTELGLAK
jgi:putative tricarboxylic transport membrane protein